MSPELLSPEVFGLEDSRGTKLSDCYALGMVIYEVLSGQVPFAQRADRVVVNEVLSGMRPERPQGVEGKWFTDDIWKILECCWNHEPGDRPSIDSVLHHLEEASKFWTPFSPLTARGTEVSEVLQVLPSNVFPMPPQLHHLDASLSRSPAQTATIMNRKEYKVSTETLKGGDSTWPVEYLDNVRLYIILTSSVLNLYVASQHAWYYQSHISSTPT